MTFTSTTEVRVYLPFVVSPGDPDCQWVNTTTTLTFSPNPSAVGQPVTLTATVSPSTATGTVTFLEGTTTLGSGILNAGMATFSTSSLPLGTHFITAIYGGNYESSTSTRILTVSKLPTTTTLTSSTNPSTFGQTVTFTATVSPSTMTGMVTFSELTCSPAPCSARFIALGSGMLIGGQATFSTSSLSADTHLIAATYSGDTNDSASTSSTLTQTVNKYPTTMTVSSSPNPSIAGQSVTFTVTVSPSSATGFVSGGTCLNVPLNNGQAKCSSTVGGPPGAHVITVIYTGDSNYVGSSATLVQVVRQPTGTSLTSSANPSTLGQSVTFTALIFFTNATGTITFLDGTTALGSSAVSKALATFSTSGLSTGNHSITATYSGDSNFGGSTSSVLTQIVH